MRNNRADGQGHGAEQGQEQRRRRCAGADRAGGDGVIRRRSEVGTRLLLLVWDPLARCLLSEGLRRRGHRVVAVSDIEEVLAAAQSERFTVALLVVPASVAPLLLRQVRALDPDLEVLWAAPPLRVSDAEALVTQAAERARQRLDGLVATAAALAPPAVPAEVQARLVAQAAELLGAAVALEPLKSRAAGRDPALSPDGRTLRLPLPRREEGAAPGDDGADYQLIATRAGDEPALSAADVARARVLAALGTLALASAAPRSEGAAPGEAAGPGSFAQLAGMLAHELNNPLTLVLANLTCLRDLLEELREGAGSRGDDDRDADAAPPRCDEALEVVAEIHSGAARVREIVRELTTIGRPRTQTVAVDEVIRAVLGIGERALKRRARLLVEVAPRLPPVRGTAGSLAQLLLNLLLNAVQAFPHAASGDPPRVVLRAEALGQDGRALVALRVIDNGPGITAEALPRVFDPGFTTKAGGSGLGLAICRQIALAHGGEISIESQAGRGTTVSVLLPAASARPATAPGARRAPASPRCAP